MVTKTPRVETLKLIEAIVDLERQNIGDFQIARKLDITPQYVHKLRKSYPEHFDKMKTIQAHEAGNPREEAQKIVEALSPRAARVLGEIIINPKAGSRERRQAAKDILDKARIGDVGEDTGEGLKGMKLILAKIYKDCNITVESVEDKGKKESEIVDVDPIQEQIEDEG